MVWSCTSTTSALAGSTQSIICDALRDLVSFAQFKKKNTYGTKVSRKVSRLNVESKSENYQKTQKNRLEWLAQITSASSFWRGASSLENFSLNKHNDVKFIVEKKLLIIVAWYGAVLLDGKIKNALKGLWGRGGRGDGGDEFKMGGSHMCYP